MKRCRVIGTLMGFVAGLGTAAVFLLSRNAPQRPSDSQPMTAPATRAGDKPEETLRLRKEVSGLQREVAELRADRRLAELPSAPKPANPEQRSSPPLNETFARVARDGFDHIGGPECEELMGQVMSANAECVPFLLDKLSKSSVWEERYYAALLLPVTGCSDAFSVKTMAEALRQEQDVVVRRMVARALTHTEGDLAAGSLRVAMTSDGDSWVRLQAAYGLARIGQDDGRQVLEQAYTSSETSPESRRAALMWLSGAAQPGSAPLFRRILSDTRDEGSLSSAISGSATLKDAAALPALHAIAASDLPQILRDEARKAIEQIQK